MSRASPLALAAMAALAMMALSGCTAGSDEPTDALDGVGGGDAHPVLYMNVTANGQTHRFSTADLPGGSGGDGSGSLSATGTATSSSGTVTAQGNATAGNGTAQGNGTASNGTVTGNAGAGNSTGDGSGGVPGMPSGDAPLNVTVEIGASGLPDEVDGAPVNWTVRWGDAFATSGGNSSASASGNGTAAKQQLEESGSRLPMRLQHTYASAGRHDLSFAVAAAGQAVDTLRTVVSVSQGMPEPGTPLGVVPFNATGEIPAGAPLTCSSDSGEEVPWTFLDALNGTPAEVSELNLTLESGGTVYDVDLYLFAPNGTELGSATGSGTDKVLELAGPFPAGDYVVSVVGCLSGGGEFDLAGSATYVAAAAKAGSPT